MIPTFISKNSDTTDVSSIGFTSGIDSTYDHYMFVMTGIYPETEAEQFGVQFNVAGESGFNEAIVSTFYAIFSAEADTAPDDPAYSAARDQVGTAYQSLSTDLGASGDECADGILHLFSPSSTTYVKHWNCIMIQRFHADFVVHQNVAGYVNVTGAIDEIDFKMASGNINGLIQMYGIA